MRRYFNRYPVDLAHNIEPSPEWLAAVDDHERAVDVNPDLMSPSEQAAQNAVIKVRREVSPLLDQWQ